MHSAHKKQTSMCSCNFELDAMNETIRQEVKSGCEYMKGFPDYYAETMDSVLTEVVNNYCALNGLSNVERCKINQYTRNYTFLLRNRALIVKINECCDVWSSGSYSSAKIKKALHNLLRYIMHGIFPMHFKPPKSEFYRGDMMLSFQVKELERNIAQNSC